MNLISTHAHLIDGICSQSPCMCRVRAPCDEVLDKLLKMHSIVVKGIILLMNHEVLKYSESG